jgi:hypothetical protein
VSGAPVRSTALADGEPDPPLADAILFHVGLLDALEAHAHPSLQRGGVVVRALRVRGQAVGRHVVHGIAPYR